MNAPTHREKAMTFVAEAETVVASGKLTSADRALVAASLGTAHAALAGLLEPALIRTGEPLADAGGLVRAAAGQLAGLRATVREARAATRRALVDQQELISGGDGQTQGVIAGAHVVREAPETPSLVSSDQRGVSSRVSSGDLRATLINRLRQADADHYGGPQSDPAGRPVEYGHLAAGWRPGAEQLTREDRCGLAAVYGYELGEDEARRRLIAEGWRPPLPKADVATLVSVVGGYIAQAFGDDHTELSRIAAKTLLDAGYLDKAGELGPPEPVATTLRRIIRDLESEAHRIQYTNTTAAMHALLAYADRLRSHPVLQGESLPDDGAESCDACGRTYPETGDQVIVSFEGRPVPTRHLMVTTGWDDGRYVELPSDFAAPSPAAAQVFFPGDTVPAESAVMDGDGRVRFVWDGWVADAVVLDVDLPSLEEWKSTVDRARAERDQTTPDTARPQLPRRLQAHTLCGSNSARQSIGDPGHCDDCCTFGHVVAHPDLGCGDVGCNSNHDEETDRA